jgi:hypothetical protein
MEKEETFAFRGVRWVYLKVFFSKPRDLIGVSATPTTFTKTIISAAI